MENVLPQRWFEGFTLGLGKILCFLVFCGIHVNTLGLSLKEEVPFWLETCYIKLNLSHDKIYAFIT